MPVGKWELLAKIIANRELAIQETTIEELKQQFIKHQGASRFIVDGFPHETAEAFTFEEQNIIQADDLEENAPWSINHNELAVTQPATS
ncbi:adenylate kinase 5, like [Esox lucius]|uniref:adenylate kinase 5, like n=1 Tax=Esox lucius TaxID=8010 RepID=UPI0009733C95|nr:adenylate kinase 5, like [Esox lucius]XP_019900077.1 adenylate kinase 5, like [Esox lucius]